MRNLLGDRLAGRFSGTMSPFEVATHCATLLSRASESQIEPLPILAAATRYGRVDLFNLGIWTEAVVDSVLRRV